MKGARIGSVANYCDRIYHVTGNNPHSTRWCRCGRPLISNSRIRIIYADSRSGRTGRNLGNLEGEENGDRTRGSSFCSRGSCSIEG